MESRLCTVRTCANRRFIVVSGLPGSGKSSLALKLAPLLGLAVIDKDEILERLFDSKGIGDTAWRQALSRQSDLIFRQESEGSAGALLVSFWRLPGMSPDSGTPTDWLPTLSNRIVNLHCECPADVAAGRFSQRKRHLGHLDHTRTCAQVLTRLRDLEGLKPLAIGERVTVCTSAEIELNAVVRDISRVFDQLNAD
jgi:predicted kinase